MKRKTLRKRVSKKSRKTRNKNISKPRNVRKTKTMRKIKTRINKKHYSRKMRGGVTETLTKTNIITIPFLSYYKRLISNKGKDYTVGLPGGKFIHYLGEYLNQKEHTDKNIHYFLEINPPNIINLYWSSNNNNSLNKRITGKYNHSTDPIQFSQEFKDDIATESIVLDVINKIKLKLSEQAAAATAATEATAD